MLQVEHSEAALVPVEELPLRAVLQANYQYHHAYRPCLKALETHLQKKEEALVPVVAVVVLLLPVAAQVA